MRRTQVDAVPAAPHAPPELVELREAEALGVLDDHHGGVRHVHAHLDRRWWPRAPGPRPRRTRAITASFSAPFEPAVEQADAHPGQGGRATPRPSAVAALHVLELLRLLDQRVDHVGLPARGHLAAHQLERRPGARAGGAQQRCARACGRAASRPPSRRRGRRRRSGPASAGSGSRSSRARRRRSPSAAGPRAGGRRTGAARPRPRGRGGWKSAPSWMRAWVPTAMCASPEASEARAALRSLPLRAEVEQLHPVGRSGRAGAGRSGSAARPGSRWEP